MVDKILIADNTIEEITVQEFSGAPTGMIITSTHGMDRGDQHTIRDIVGLKTKLHDIEKLHQVRSNLGGHADYYQWGEEATENNPIGPGYFVRLGADGKIYKCEGEEVEIQTTLPLETKKVIADDSEAWSEADKITTYIYYVTATKTYYNYEVNAWVGYTEEEYKQIALDKIIMKYAYAGEIQTKDISKYYVVGTYHNETKQWIEPFDIYAYNGIEYVKKPSYSYKDGKVYKNALMDVFGVTIHSAGFVGNDANIDGTYTSAKANDTANYALVATTGVVDVICDHEVVVGDYVYPYACGRAKKSTGSYGYLVTALMSDVNNILYARIVLTPSVVLAKEVSNNVDSLLETTRRLDKNITTFGNTAEQALKRAEELTEAAQQSANTSSQNAQDATNAAVNAQNSANKAWGVAEQVVPSAQKAVEDAQAAQKSALELRDDTIASANETAAKIATDKSNETLNTVKALEYRLDDYTVGKYSQAYGLTYAQAKAILPLGTTFIPIDEDCTVGLPYSEFYANEEADIEQVFTVGYAYVWTNNGWLVDKTVLITRTPTDRNDGDFWFVTEDYDKDEYKRGALYRWESGKWVEKAIRVENTMSRTIAHLYHEDDTIRQSVSTVDGKVAAVETKVTETDARVGLVASVPTELVDVKPGNYNAETEQLDLIADKTTLDTDWTDKAVDGQYYVVGNKLPYEVYQWNGSEFVLRDTIAYDGVNFCKVNIASIFTTANEEGSRIQLNADKIDFATADYTVIADNLNLDGYVQFTNFEETLGKTTINGDQITTGVIQSEDGKVKIDLTNGDVDITGRVVATSGEIGGCTIDKDGKLTVPAEIITGKLSAEHIESVNIDVTELHVDKLSSLSDDMGEIKMGLIQSPEYDDGTEVIVWGETEINDEQEELTPSEGLAYTLSADETYYIVTCGTCTDSHIVIPLTYNGKPVESIGDSAFDSCTNLTSIVIPDSIISIGNFAFIGCSSLTNITMSSSVISIGYSAFAECSSLISIVIPNGVVSIGQFAFWDCNSLISIIIPDSITTMGTAVFQKCDLLTIYCEAESQPSGWDSAWNSSDCPVYWYSKTQPTADGNYWHYKTPQGFKISCKGKYMINSPNFKVTQDGQIEATNGEFRGHLTTGSGYIGNLKIEDNGISATIDDQVILSVSSLGVISTNSLQAADGVVANTLQSFDEAAKLDFSAIKTTTTEIGREVVDIALESNIIDEGSENFWGTITNEGRVSLTVDIGDTVFQVPQVLSIKVKYNRFNAFGDEYTQTSNHTVTLPAGQTTATIYIPYRILADDSHTMCFNTAAVMTELTKINEASKEERAIACTGHFIPADGLSYTLGAQDIKWKEAWINAASINTQYADSDKNKKHNISTLTNQHSKFFDKLKPVTFIYNDDTENKIRTGLIAQDTKQALDEVGLDNYAIYHEWQESNGDNTCSLIYQDLIALCVNEIQKLKKQVTGLEDRLKELENKTK